MSNSGPNNSNKNPHSRTQSKTQRSSRSPPQAITSIKHHLERNTSRGNSRTTLPFSLNVFKDNEKGPAKSHIKVTEVSESPSIFGILKSFFTLTHIQGGRRKSKKVRSKRRRHTIRK